MTGILAKMDRPPDSVCSQCSQADTDGLAAFTCDVVDQARRAGGVVSLPGGTIRLPTTFGFCRGVTVALRMLQRTVAQRSDRRLVLLGEIIHNPSVNAYFALRGVQVLTRQQRQHVEQHIGPEDVAIIPAFGVPVPIERRLREIGCEVVDTSCGDVRRLWKWADQAVDAGFGVLIFGRADHDETVVTKSRLAEAGGRYVVAGSLNEVDRLGEMIATDASDDAFRSVFGPESTNADQLEAFHRLAIVSQTTMLYGQTMAVHARVRDAFERRFADAMGNRLRFQPTVCRATQQRQDAAVALCEDGVEVMVVVGGFGSSNTRHLYELASRHGMAVFIETASAIHGAEAVDTFDPASGKVTRVDNWLGAARPITVGILAGASTPETAVGEVIETLADLLR